MPDNPLLEGLARHFSPAELSRLGQTRVGIAGAGGLGSNLALLLCRSGVGGLLLVDYDSVESSNLNRQHFWPRHLGRLKTEALAESLLELNPALKLELLNLKLDESNIDSCIAKCDIWAEALDGPQIKALLVERGLLAGCRVVAASGICGLGGAPMRKRKLGKLIAVGDFQSDAAHFPPLAPRVTQAASLMADAILEFVLKDA